MRALVTGAGGAIGVHVLAHLIENTDWEIVCVDSFKAEHKGFYDRITALISWKGDDWKNRVKIVTHDLNAPFSPREIETIGHIDYIINLASRSDVQNSIDDPIPFVRNNTELMLTMLEYARIVKPKVFLQFSTDEVYGSTTKDSGGHKEWDVIKPSNPYSASKACQEAMAIAWWRSYGVPVVLTNTMNNFGEMQAPSKFPAMIQKKIESGEEIQVHVAPDGEIGTRYYLHSRNAADAVLFILQNIEPNVHPEHDLPTRLNIVGDKQVSNLELVETIAHLMGKKANIKMVSFHEHNPGHDLHYGLDGALLKSFGWEPPLTFEESMQLTIDWQQANKQWLQ